MRDALVWLLFCLLLITLGCSTDSSSNRGGYRDTGVGSYADTDTDTDLDADTDANVGILSVTVIDVWQCESILLVFPNGETMLVDGGCDGYGDSTVLPLLDEWGIDTLDLVVLTHPHADHCGGLDEVVDAVNVDEVWEGNTTYGTATYNKFVQARNNSGAVALLPETGHMKSFGDVSVEVIATATGYSDVNNESIVIMVTYGSVRFLLMGDAENEENEDILDAYDDSDLTAQVLKVQHHGSSKFDIDFPPAVSPDYAAISCGSGNLYGHPTRKALRAYKNVGATICRTDLLGDIEFTTNGSTIESNCDN